MTAIPRFQIVPAGAGSGKTYRIQEQLADWITDGLIAPERIMAVTYTEAAAAELRERISAGLLARDRVEDALRLSQAYISTIHGLGLRLLAEFAFQAGMSPRPRLLNDDEQNTLVRTALARTDRADLVLGDLDAFGYTYSFGTGKSGEESFRDTVLEAVQLLRTIGASDASGARPYAEIANRRIARNYGRAEPDNGRTRRLRKRAQALLEAFPRCLDEHYGFNATAERQFRADFKVLSMAARPGTLESDWGLWQKLRRLRVRNGKAGLPDGYFDLAAQVIGEAEGLVRHEGPLRHAQSHVKALLAAGQDVLESYNEAKRLSGLVDYTDMIALSERLLRERPETLDALAARVDCLVVDEFQDANPLQFMLLWRIREAGIPTLVVGDLKQAIMGFQGADPRLFAALMRSERGMSQPLTRNWRSTPGLMEFANAVGPVLFGSEYVALEPQRKPGPMEPLEVVAFEKNPWKARNAICAYAMARRLTELLDDPDQRVVDRRSGEIRRLRGSDVAVLCPTNRTLSEYADVFRQQGLSVNHQTGGWLMSRPVQIAIQALAYLANPADSHAALYLAATELGSCTLEDGLRQLIDGGRIEEPLLQRLDALAEGVVDRTVYALVADTISALGLFDEITAWPDGEQARANLVRLLGEAAEFMDANREALAHGGYHGYGTKTFLAWLATRQDEDEQPLKAVLDEDAISLLTWHRSKGLEWPVVAVCNLDRRVRGRLPNLAVEYPAFDDLSKILECAEIRYTPRYAAPEQNKMSLMALDQVAVTEARRLLYVALTRARDKLVLEWPGFQKKGSLARTPSYWELVGSNWQLRAAAGKLVVAGRKLQCGVSVADLAAPDRSGTHFEWENARQPVVGRRAIRRAEPPEGGTPDAVAASAMAGLADGTLPPRLEIARYGDVLELETELVGAPLGTYLHQCFELLGSRPDLLGRLAELTGVEMEAPSLERTGVAVARFEEWHRRRLGTESVMREWPVLAVDENGSVLSGEADLVLQTPEGVWVLDHKSDRVDDLSATFQRYLPQLEAYATALREEGRRVAGIGINLIRRGEVALMRFGRAAAEPHPAGVRAPVRNGASDPRVP